KYLCIGHDPDLQKIPQAKTPAEAIIAFNRAVIDATKDIVCAYKPNSAFFEAYGEEGFAALRETCAYILSEAPKTAIILDAKRADIGNTNAGYVSYAFEQLRADAVTLHPYLGAEALQPFLDRKDKGLFILCRTSNPGAGEFQDLDIGGEPLYMCVARNVANTWDRSGNCGLVVGATYPEEIANVRKIAPELPFLIPGVGSQGGDLEASVKAAENARGGFVISVSRAVLYASSGPDFAQAAGEKASEYHQAIQAAL